MTAFVYKNQLSGSRAVVYKNLNVELACDWSAVSAISKEFLSITFVEINLVITYWGAAVRSVLLIKDSLKKGLMTTHFWWITLQCGLLDGHMFVQTSTILGAIHKMGPFKID